MLRAGDGEDGYYSPRSFSSARSSFSMADGPDLERMSNLDVEVTPPLPPLLLALRCWEHASFVLCSEILWLCPTDVGHCHACICS